MNKLCEKEKKIANEVVAVSIGSKLSQEQLRYCIAIGADRGNLSSFSILYRYFGRNKDSF